MADFLLDWVVDLLPLRVWLLLFAAFLLVAGGLVLWATH